MKTNNYTKPALIGFLSSFVLVQYIGKFKSIILGADMPSYFIYGAVLCVCGLLLYSRNELKDWVNMTSVKYKDKKSLPQQIYLFCKKYYFESEIEIKKFVKNEVKDKDLANFFVKYVDKSDREEIQEYIETQRNKIETKASNARKVISFNNICILFAIGASYIYDSSIKGILVVSGVLALYNLISSRNIEKNIIVENEMLHLYENVSEDIYNFKNAKYIMYKCESLLMISDNDMTVDTLEIREPRKTASKTVAKTSEPEKTQTKPGYDDMAARRSALITINKKESNISNRENKRITM